jgi:RecA/RadA recombinase
MSTKYPSPLLGYNNNVRHKGKVFHIQTEDSGVKYGHIITHLFMDGGRILKSVKTSYAEYVGNQRMADVVREMMKQQHKAMFIALRDGKFDPMSEGRGDASQATRALVAESPPGPPSDAAASPSPSEVASPAVPADAPPGDPTEAPSARPSVDTAIGPLALHQPASAAELTLDIDALERPAAASAAAPVPHTVSDLPAPPAHLFREKTPGKYRMSPVPEALGANPTPPAPRPPAATTTPLAPAPPARAGHTPAPVMERRYAPARPASIFGQTRPQQGKSIFGEDLISDKSLDEVILSYLAQDLDEKK